MPHVKIVFYININTTFRVFINKTIILNYLFLKCKSLRSMETIGEKISKLLKDSGFSQKELAMVAGATESAITHYIKGERIPRVDVVANLATALNTTSDYIISGHENQNFPYSEIKKPLARNAEGLSQDQKIESAVNKWEI